MVTGIDYNAVLSNASAPAPRAQSPCAGCCILSVTFTSPYIPVRFIPLLCSRPETEGKRNPDRRQQPACPLGRALTASGVSQELPILVSRVTGFSRPTIQGVESDWTAWMNESRSILRHVYDANLREAILDAESSNTGLPGQTLDDVYVVQMQNISRQRLGLAGLRLAIFFENELP